MDKEQNTIQMTIESSMNSTEITVDENQVPQTQLITGKVISSDSANNLGKYIPENICKYMKNSYEKNVNGPFEVHFEKVYNNRAISNKSFSEIKIGKLINQAMPDLWKFAFNLKNMGSYKFSVTFPDPLIANRFVTRMTKVGKSNSQPNAALYMGKKIRFSPYIQKVKRCYNCQRFGHLIAQCRGGEQGRFCASKDHNIGDCKENKNACINCIRHKMSSFNHKANDPKCPIFIECRQLKVIMAKLGLGPSDALNFYKQNSLDLGMTSIIAEGDINQIKEP
ncbi:hypothetical protein EAI_12748 [Harpegnathos saltator]|uniref:CCHC-type domain-containing protein n=1 Tax=Harpegnathos saltator TaxID=610380 RepID=E2BI67_HARSA|nr:hypothetical protein EAI_12748 [Harpegnathos saltator]